MTHSGRFESFLRHTFVRMDWEFIANMFKVDPGRLIPGKGDLMEIRHADLTNIGGGIAPNLFKLGLSQVLGNLQDEKTDPKKPRKVVLEFTFKSDIDRAMTEVDVNLKTTLAPIGGKKALVYLSQDNEGEPRMTTNDPKQAELAFGLAKGLSAVAGGNDQ